MMTCQQFLALDVERRLPLVKAWIEMTYARLARVDYEVIFKVQPL